MHSKVTTNNVVKIATYAALRRRDDLTKKDMTLLLNTLFRRNAKCKKRNSDAGCFYAQYALLELVRAYPELAPENLDRKFLHSAYSDLAKRFGKDKIGSRKYKLLLRRTSEYVPKNKEMIFSEKMSSQEQNNTNIINNLSKDFNIKLTFN